MVLSELPGHLAEVLAPVSTRARSGKLRCIFRNCEGQCAAAGEGSSAVLLRHSVRVISAPSITLFDELATVIHPREGHVRDRHLEELAQRLPALRRAPHEQALGRDGALDLVMVALHSLDQLLGLGVALRERTRLRSTAAGRSCADSQPSLDRPRPVASDSRRITEPPWRTAQTVARMLRSHASGSRVLSSTLASGILLHELLVEVAARPVDGRAVAVEQLGPRSIAVERALPKRACGRSPSTLTMW